MKRLFLHYLFYFVDIFYKHKSTLQMSAIKLSFFLWSFLFPIFGFAQPKVILSQNWVFPGKNLHYDVKVDDFKDIFRLELVLKWDRDLLSYVNKENADSAWYEREAPVFTTIEDANFEVEYYGQFVDSVKVTMISNEKTGFTSKHWEKIFTLFFLPIKNKSLSPIKVGMSSKLFQVVNGIEKEITLTPQEGFVVINDSYDQILNVQHLYESRCQMENYEGYNKNGKYVDVYKNQFGNDSIRFLILDVSNTDELNCLNNKIYYIPKNYDYLVLSDDLFLPNNIKCLDNVTTDISGSQLPSNNIFSLGNTSFKYCYDNRDTCDYEINIEETPETPYNFGLSISDIVVQEGKIFCLNVSGNYFQEISAMDFSLSWDSDKIELIKTETVNSIFKNLDTQLVEEGTLRCSWNRLVLNLSVSQIDIISLCFRAKVQGNTTINFFSEKNAGNKIFPKFSKGYNYDFQPVLLKKGNITIEEGFCRDTQVHEVIQFCGEYYLFDLDTLTEPGFYHDTLQTNNGCDSIVDLVLFFTDYSLNEEITLCLGDEYQFGDQVITENGFYTRRIESLSSCDTIVNLVVSVESDYLLDYVNICEGESHQQNGKTYNATGVYRDTLVSSYGCSKIVDLDLFVGREDTIFMERRICRGGFLEIAGIELREAGLHEIFLPKEGNSSYRGDCGKRYFIEVELYPYKYDTTYLNDTICEGYPAFFGGEVLSENGTYEHINDFGFSDSCVFSVILNLEVTPSSYDTIYTTICQGETYPFGPYNVPLRTSGEYILRHKFEDKCDSIEVLYLTVMDEIIFQVYDTICRGETYLIGNQEFQSGFHKITLTSLATGCDSIIQLYLYSWESISDLILANAGIDDVTCENRIHLIGNLPEQTNGQWTTTGSSIIGEPNLFSIVASNLPIGESTFYWSLSSNKCNNYSKDSVTITRLAIPTAIYDSIIIKENTLRIFNVTNNDLFLDEAMEWRVLLASVPAIGKLENIGNGEFSYQPKLAYIGITSFTYQLCNETCLPNGCTTATVFINIQGDEIGVGIDPIPAPLPNDYETSKIQLPTIQEGELFIFNIWGQMVDKRFFFQGGQQELINLQKNELPAGIYFYVKKAKGNTKIVESGKLIAIGR